MAAFAFRGCFLSVEFRRKSRTGRSQSGAQDNAIPYGGRVSVPTSTVGLAENKAGYSVHDLWTGEAKKTSGTISAVVPSHGLVLYRVNGI
jgi:hypothetical protein